MMLRSRQIGGGGDVDGLEQRASKKTSCNDLEEQHLESFEKSRVNSRGSSVKSVLTNRTKSSSLKTTMERIVVTNKAADEVTEARLALEKIKMNMAQLEVEKAIRKQVAAEQLSNYHAALLEQESNCSDEQRMQDVEEELEYVKSAKQSHRTELIAQSNQIEDKGRPHPQQHQSRGESNTNDLTQALATALTNAITQVQGKQTSSTDMRAFMARQAGGQKELPSFWGEPETWINFHSQLMRSTELCGYSDQENILRLQKYLRGKAKEAVESLLVTSGNFREIVQTLERRFGRPQMIIKSLMEKARNVDAPTDGNMESLLDFSIAVKNLCSTAKALNLPEYLANPQLLEEFVMKLPTHLKLDWGWFVMKHADGRGDLVDLAQFLDGVSLAASYVGDASFKTIKKERERDQHCDRDRKDVGRKPHHAMVVKEEKCFLGCSKPHDLDYCKKFKTMETTDRWNTVKKNGLCFSCLKKGHLGRDCSTAKQCDINGCNSRHHTLLHRNSGPSKGREEKQDEDPESSFAGMVKTIDSQVWMRIIPVWLQNGSKKVQVNAFLDEGSEVSMIDEDIAKELGLEGKPWKLNLGWLDGATTKKTSSSKVDLKIAGVGKNAEWFTLKEVRTFHNLQLPAQPLQQYKFWRKWSHLRQIPFVKCSGARPLILLGQDNIHLTCAREIREGTADQPIASLTKLGWVVHGKSPKKKQNSDPDLAFVTFDDDKLHQLVKEQFRLEALGIKVGDLPRSKEDTRAEELMKKLTRRVGDRWETPMLWKEDNMVLPESKKAALRRLFVIEKEMDKDPQFADLYCAKIDEYVQKGFCRKLTAGEAAVENERTWYLPHFGTRNPNKPGKLRLVFDCAARVNGMGLNDALLQGPDLMVPLLTVLAKFRQKEIAFAGDIRDMFHMVNITEEDLPSLRFLWRGRNRGQHCPPEVWTMNVMVFGAVSSPYQAQWVKNNNAEEYRQEFPAAVDAIQKSHYVDEYLDSTSTVEQAIRKIMDVREVHRRGGFEIRGWLCNSVDVLKVVSPGENHNMENLDLLAEDKLERVLGLYWDPVEDVFKFKKRFRTVPAEVVDGKRMPTKREILSLVSCLFDPLGFLAHLTIKAKILMQDIWRSAVGWDDQLPVALEVKWMALLQQFDEIVKVKIPRCYAPDISSADDLQLHVFCDASSQAFCGVGYIRAT